jgi:type III secretion protein V
MATSHSPRANHRSAVVTATLTDIRRYTDLALAALVVSIIVMMALPLPSWSLDVLVATNIFAGVTLLLIALFIPTPLAFSTFPSVLLLTTLFRTSLNVATTRQILLHTNGGEIIDAFGNMVVGGSLVVGLVIFLIITVVQFIVVAKGAERVAEVGARFTLDALPGKQMSIDADLRAGVISQTEAFNRRRELVEESHFYGSMDGAMKFVKGDAVAGIVIVAVNLLGGITIGTLTLGMSFAEAIQRFSVLSIGDGLVSQIPSLFVSIAAGIAITRTAPDNSANLGDQIGRQLGTQPRALMLSAVVMLLFALVPDFPTITFLVLAGSTAFLSVALTRRQQRRSDQQVQEEVPAAAREGEVLPMLLQGQWPLQRSQSAERPPSTFRLELSSSLVERLGAADLNVALADERAALREHYGIPFPGLVLRTSPTLPGNSFSILVQDLAELTLSVPESAVLLVGTMDPKAQASLLQSYSILDEPAPEWLLPAVWVSDAQLPELQSEIDLPDSFAKPLEILDLAHVVARLVMRAIQRNPASALGVQEVRQLIREIEWRFGDLAREAQAILPLGRLADLMAALARERVPLADFPGLLQAVVTHGPGAPDTHALYEAMRLSLARGIVASLLPKKSKSGFQLNRPELTAVTLDAEFEMQLRAALTMRPDGPVLALPTPQVEAALVALIAAFEQSASSGTQVIALSADIRRAASRLFRAGLPRVAFLSHEELGAASVVAKSSAQAKWRG